MTPTENRAAVQLPFGASASRLAAFAGKLIDIAFHQSGTLVSHLQRRLQFLQGIAQGGPQAAELVQGCFSAEDADGGERVGHFGGIKGATGTVAKWSLNKH